MDKRTVFADGLTFPNGVLPWGGGIIVTCAPDVLFLKDNDGDGVADERKVLLTGFATTGSTQLRVNAPTVGPWDGLIYLAAGLSGGTVTCPSHPERPPLKMTSDIRFHPKTLEVELVDGKSQYGMSFDVFGNRFICMNRVPVQHVVFQSKWLKRNPRLAFSETVQDCNERDAFNGINGGHDGVRLFPISANITTADGHAGSFSAACGVKVWQGKSLLTPECASAVFSCDPTGNLEAMALRNLEDQHHNWSYFYELRQKLYEDYRLEAKALKPGERKARKKAIKERNAFPGYILIHADLSDPEIMPLIKSVTGVVGFLGSKDQPVPLRPNELSRILGTADNLSEAEVSDEEHFMVGESVKVVDGPFNDFDGVIEEVNEEKRKLKVMVKIFGRRTPLELNYNQIQKL
jgi:transcription termination/antitermination factor NusG